METVGVFEVPKQNGKYETGQVSVGLLKGSYLVTGLNVIIF